MNEKYGIELEAKVNKFKTVMQSTANYVKNLAKNMKDAMTVAPKSTLYQGMSKDDLQKELKKQQSIARQMKENMSAKNIDKTGSVFTKSKKMYAEAISRVSILKNRIKESNDELEKTEQISKENDSGLSNVFKKGIANIKRFSFYLLGARSVFTLFNKYQNIYYQYNEQMQYQSELSQNAIALSLAPAFEFLGNVIAYASIGFAKFIELLTGVNVLSKVTTKGIRDYNKSLKETQTLIAGVDEITNLTTPNSTGLAGQYQALADFQKKIAEVTKAFKENPFLKAVADVVEYVKENWYWIKWLALGTFLSVGTISLGFKVAGLAKTLGTIGTIKGIGTIGTGLAGFASALMWLAGIGIITTEVVTIYKIITEGKEKLEEEEKKLNELENMRQNQYIKTYETIIKKLKEMKDNGVLEEDPTYQTYLNELNEQWKRIATGIQNGEGYTQAQIDKVNLLGEEAKRITGIDYTMEIEIKPTTKESAWTKFKNKFMEILGGGDKGLGHIFSGLFNFHATGLDYVPYDNYPAMLHKGEAVVPAKYNPAIHSAGNDYTNSLLETLVVKMDDLASRPNVFEVDGQKFATATYGLYKGQENRQNYNTNVVVR